ncbi:DUF6941 family protein [Arthrobacter antibioticus]|uniref:DUF6941 family protein n=1 Tax=Arthrobacter sp. H35-MC1 TaxID=3046203 RepID=UPI0024BBA83E|nr:hypothetical protein [Arthrobacter sp. H35-MC1]MDJ0317316.1 hypothetical protein [Arthrobacter sp. H35-MC1]
MRDLSRAGGTILIADFVNIDAAGKVNIIGGGVQFLGFDPDTGITAPFSLFANVTVSLPSLDDVTATVEVALIDADGQPVTVPSQDGQAPLQFTQTVDFAHTINPEIQAPPMGFPGSSNVVLNFPSGLPLPVGTTYEWVVLMDGMRLASTTFFVPGTVEA